MKTNFVDIFLLYCCTLCQILTSSLKIPISIRVEIDGDNNVAEFRTNHNDAEADAIKFCEAHGLGDDVVAMLVNEAEQTLHTRNTFGLETLVMKDTRYPEGYGESDLSHKPWPALPPFPIHSPTI